MMRYELKHMIEEVLKVAQQEPDRVVSISMRDSEGTETTFTVDPGKHVVKVGKLTQEQPSTDPVTSRENLSGNRRAISNAYDNGYENGKLDAETGNPIYRAGYDTGHRDGYQIGMKDGVSVERRGYAK